MKKNLDQNKMNDAIKSQLDSKNVEFSEEFSSKIAANIFKLLKQDENKDEDALKIATKVVQLMKLNEKKEEKLVYDDCWNYHDNFLICNPCFLYAKVPYVPAHLKGSNRGAYGYIKKENQTASSMKRSKISHCKIELHTWCSKQLKDETTNKTKTEEANKIAGQKIVANILLCFQRSWGAQDFLALNAKDKVATKNDSRQMFFRLRNVIFEIASDKTREYFKSIKYISVTLDKVTGKSLSEAFILTN